MENWDNGVMLGAFVSAVAGAVILPISMLQATLDTEPQAVHKIMTCDNVIHAIEDYKYASDQYAVFVKQDNGEMRRITEGEWKVDTIMGETRAHSFMIKMQLQSSQLGTPCTKTASMREAITPDETLFSRTIGKLLPSG